MQVRLTFSRSTDGTIRLILAVPPHYELDLRSLHGLSDEEAIRSLLQTVGDTDAAIHLAHQLP